MSVFGGDSSWRKDTPGAYMLDVVRAAGSFGDSFQKSFEAAADRKDGQQKFDKKLTQDAQQFRDKIIEEQRQFDIIHPDPMRPWQSTPVTAPPIDTPPPALMPSPGYDQQFKQPATTPTFGMRFYAEGGRPATGEPAVVGERGPEVFVPDRPGTIIPNDEIGMRYDRNGTGAFTPTKIDARWDGSPKPTWMTQPAVSWRATNAVDAVGKVTQAQTFADLTRIQAENPEAGMYPQFQNALRQKSMVLERGEAIALRQKQVENNSVAAKSALDLNKRFNSRVLQLPDSFHVAVRALGDAGRNPDGTPSPAAMQVLEAGEAAVEAQREAQAKAAELALTRIDAKGGKTYGVLPGARGSAADLEVRTLPDERGVPAFQTVVDAKTGRPVGTPRSVQTAVPMDAKALQANKQSEISVAQDRVKDLNRQLLKLDATDPERGPMARAVRAAESDLSRLREEKVALSTNWQGKASAPAAASAIVETERQTADGKIAIYDANTKKFLRWK